MERDPVAVVEGWTLVVKATVVLLFALEPRTTVHGQNPELGGSNEKYEPEHDSVNLSRN